MPHLHLFARLCLLLGLMVASTLAFVVQKSFSSPFGLISRNQNANDRSLVLLESSNHKRKKDQAKDLGFSNGFGKSNKPGKKSDSSSNRTSGENSDSLSKTFFYADTELSAAASGNDRESSEPTESADSVESSSASSEPASAKNVDVSNSDVGEPAKESQGEGDQQLETVVAGATDKEGNSAESVPSAPPMPDYIKLEAENDPRTSNPGRQVNIGASAARGAQSMMASSTSSMNAPPQPIDRTPYQSPPGAPMDATPSPGYPNDRGAAPVDPGTEMYIEALEAKMKLLDQKIAIIAEASETMLPQEPPFYDSPPPPTTESLPVDRSDLFLPGSRGYATRKPIPDLPVDSPSFLSGDSFITGGTAPAIQSGNRAVTRTTPPTAPGTGMSNSMGSIPVDREDLFLPGSPHPDRYLPGAPKFPTTNNPNLRGQLPLYAQQQIQLQEFPPQGRAVPPPPPPPPPGKAGPPPPPESMGPSAPSQEDGIGAFQVSSPPPGMDRDSLMPDRADVFMPRSRNDVYLPGSPVTASGAGSGMQSPVSGSMENRPSSLSVDRQDAFLPARPGMNYPQSPPPPQPGSVDNRPSSLAVDRPDALIPARPGMSYPPPPPGPLGGRPSSISMDRSDVFLPAPTHAASRTTASSLASDLVEKLRLDVDAPGRGFSNGDAFASGSPPRDPSRMPADGGASSFPPPQDLTVDRPDVYLPAAPHGTVLKPSLTSQQLAKLRSLPEDTPRAFNPGPDWKK